MFHLEEPEDNRHPFLKATASLTRMLRAVLHGAVHQGDTVTLFLLLVLSPCCQIGARVTAVGLLQDVSLATSHRHVRVRIVIVENTSSGDSVNSAPRFSFLFLVQGQLQLQKLNLEFPHGPIGRFPFREPSCFSPHVCIVRAEPSDR